MIIIKTKNNIKILMIIMIMIIYISQQFCYVI